MLSTVLKGLKSDGSDSSKTKVRDLEVFDGSDPCKLRGFLVTLSLVFFDHPNYFTNQQKISYTLSYLGGSAREWFEPDVLDPNGAAMPAWMLTFSALVKELQDNFGLYDAQGDAKEKLGSLRMKENEQIQKYKIWFNTLAVATGWDLNALKWAYQRGLASRIKDELARIPEPKTLAEYRTEVAQINNRYWRREEEKKREAGQNMGNSNNKNTNQSKKGTGNPTIQNTTTLTSTNSNTQPKTSGSNKGTRKQNKSWFGKPKGSNLASLASLVSCTPRPWDKFLSSNSKLKPKEYEHQKKFGLCLFCGEKHKFEDCQKRKSNQRFCGRLPMFMNQFLNFWPLPKFRKNSLQLLYPSTKQELH